MAKRVVKVLFGNGDYFFTEVNGTVSEIRNYYVGTTFNLGTVNDDLQKCVAVEFLSGE